MFSNMIREFGSFFSDWYRQVKRGLGKPGYRRSLIRWYLVLGALPVLGMFLAVAVVVFYARSLPSLETLERIEPNLITRVYDKDTSLVHEFFTQRRIWTPADQIPKAQKLAVFAIEDQ